VLTAQSGRARLTDHTPGQRDPSSSPMCPARVSPHASSVTDDDRRQPAKEHWPLNEPVKRHRQVQHDDRLPANSITAHKLTFIVIGFTKRKRNVDDFALILTQTMTLQASIQPYNFTDNDNVNRHMMSSEMLAVI